MSHYVKNPEAILTTISKPFTDPVDWLHDVGETAYGVANAPGKLLADTVGNFSPKGKEFLRMPTYDELGKPGQAFAERIDAKNAILPADMRQYAQPLEAFALNFVPGVGPLASAAFNTAYQGGKQQQLNKGFDWGELGKNAAINFGTAGLTMGAKELLSSANAANAAKAAAGPSGFSSTAKLAGSLPNDLTSILGDASSNFAPAAQAGNLAASSANALNGIGGLPSTASALSGFTNQPTLSQTYQASESVVPKAQALQSSGLGDAAYKAAIRSGEGLVKSALADTLAPKGAQPISGALDSFGNAVDGQYQTQWGDVLNAFGGVEATTPNPDGYRINEDAMRKMQERLGANIYLQESQARDQAIPAGQYRAEENTPYANRLNSISKGADQSYADLAQQVNNANKYYSIIDSNPGLTPEDLDKFLGDTSTGIMGNFRVPNDQLDYFKGIRTLGPQNMSLL